MVQLRYRPPDCDEFVGQSSISMTDRYLEAAKGEAVQAHINAAFGISLDLKIAEGAAVM